MFLWFTGWWFGTFFIFPYIGNSNPNWLSYFSEGKINHQPVHVQLITASSWWSGLVWLRVVEFSQTPKNNPQVYYGKGPPVMCLGGRPEAHLMLRFLVLMDLGIIIHEPTGRDYFRFIMEYVLLVPHASVMLQYVIILSRVRRVGFTVSLLRLQFWLSPVFIHINTAYCLWYSSMAAY